MTSCNSHFFYIFCFSFCRSVFFLLAKNNPWLCLHVSWIFFLFSFSFSEIFHRHYKTFHLLSLYTLFFSTASLSASTHFFIHSFRSPPSPYSLMELFLHIFPSPSLHLLSSFIFSSLIRPLSSSYPFPFPSSALLHYPTPPLPQCPAFPAIFSPSLFPPPFSFFFPLQPPCPVCHHAQTLRRSQSPTQRRNTPRDPWVVAVVRVVVAVVVEGPLLVLVVKSFLSLLCYSRKFMLFEGNY